MKTLKLSVLLTAIASPALAHPGHGADPATHWIADPAHLAVTAGLAALAIVVAGVGLARRRTRTRRKSE
jgi:hypothetical protein